MVQNIYLYRFFGEHIEYCLMANIMCNVLWPVKYHEAKSPIKTQTNVPTNAFYSATSLESTLSPYWSYV